MICENGVRGDVWTFLLLAGIGQSVITSSKTCIYYSSDSTCSEYDWCYDTCDYASEACEFMTCDMFAILQKKWGMVEYDKCFHAFGYDAIITCEDEVSVCDDDDICLSVCSSSSGQCEGCFESRVDTSSMPTATCDQLATSVIPKYYPQFTGYCDCFTYINDGFTYIQYVEANITYDAMLRCNTSACETNDTLSDKDNYTGMIMIFVSGAVVLVAVVIALIYCKRGKKQL